MKKFKLYYSNKEKKEMKKKGIAIALATGIIAGNLPANLTYAETNAIDRLNSELGIDVNENMSDNKNIKIGNNFTADKRTVQEINRVTLNDGKIIRDVKLTTTNSTIPIEDNVVAGTPNVAEQNLYFNKRNPKDVVIKNVNFNGTKLTKLGIGTTAINIDEVEVTSNSIRIPKEIIKKLNIENGHYPMVIGFSNGGLSVGVVDIEIAGKYVESIPTIEKQELSFDRSNPQDMVIKNVDFKGLNVKSLSIVGKHIDINTLTTTDNSIIVPKEFIVNLPINNGKYYVTIQFDDGSTSFQDVKVDITGTTTPNIEGQTISFDINNPEDVVIENVNLKGLEVKYIYINGNSIPASSLKIEDDKIIIPVNVLESLDLTKGVYEISFKFLNETTLLNRVYLNVTDSISEEKPDVKPEEKPDAKPEEKPEEKPDVKPEEKPDVKPEEKPDEKPEVTPPVENNHVVNADKGEEIVLDITKPTDIKIVSSKLENKDVEYILINGIKVTRTSIEGKITRSISGYATDEYFTTSNGSITLSSKLFEDLNLEAKEGYSIGVGFADGSEITDLVKLSIVDSSIDNIVTPPVEDNGNDSNNGNSSNVENNSNSGNTTNGESTPNNGNSSTTNELPNTGSPIGSGAMSVFGMLSVFVGSVLFKKKK